MSSDMNGLYCIHCGLPLEKVGTEFCSEKCRQATQKYLDQLASWRRELKEEFSE